MDCGFNNKETQGLFSKINIEGVSLFLGRWFPIRWLKTRPGGNGGGPTDFEPPRGGAMGGLVGALGSLAPEHQNAKEIPWENEELTADSPSDLS